MPITAHFSSAFFVKSETFIYHYLRHMETFHPICLGWRLENLGSFEFPTEDLYLLQHPRYSFSWFRYGLLKRFFKRDFYFEKILKERDVRVIHAHFGHNGAQALRLRGKPGVPLVTTFYGADLSRYDVIEPLKEQYNRLFSEGEMFLVEGAHMKEKLHQLGCPREKIHIQRIAIPIDRIKYKERKPKSGHAVKFVFCGRFTEKKGLIYALSAVKKVKEERPGCALDFCIIGDGELRGEIEDFVKDHGMAGYVRLPGFLNYDAYLKEVEEADIFIHPSVTASDGDSEGGAPTTILEAQAMGLPVLSTTHADIPNIVAPGKSALLSEERDIDGLSRNIIELLENQDRWPQMGKEGRRFVEAHHDIKEAKELEKKYGRLIG